MCKRRERKNVERGWEESEKMRNRKRGKRVKGRVGRSGKNGKCIKGQTKNVGRVELGYNG